ncbi:MAG: precorrin-2 C(20)-methyltransferase [Oscillospiraceae bacterium]
MLGKFFGVSVGSGDPELITLKSIRILNQCDIIAVPISNDKTTAFDIVKQVVDFSNKTILYLNFLMVRDKSKLDENHTYNANTIIEYLNQGKDVAMVNLGDTSIYSTFSYICKKIVDQGFEVEISSGVPSFCECANRLNISLTTMNEPVHIVPSSYEGIEDILNLKGTKVIMKTSKNTAKLQLLLKDKHYYVCQNCGLESEKFSETLPDNTGYFTTIIVKD